MEVNSDEIASHVIETVRLWVISQTSILLLEEELHVDKACPVSISSFDDPECVTTEPADTSIFSPTILVVIITSLAAGIAAISATALLFACLISFTR